MKRLLVIVLILGVVFAPVQARASSSTNYQIQEDDIGGGGRTESSSANFTAQDALGDAAQGSSGSAAYSQEVGPITTNDPTLTVVDVCDQNGHRYF